MYKGIPQTVCHLEKYDYSYSFIWKKSNNLLVLKITATSTNKDKTEQDLILSQTTNYDLPKTKFCSLTIIWRYKAHRAATKVLHSMRSPARRPTWPQDFSALFSSASMLPLQVVLGMPLRRLPSGVQCRAVWWEFFLWMLAWLDVIHLWLRGMSKWVLHTWKCIINSMCGFVQNER